MANAAFSQNAILFTKKSSSPRMEATMTAPLLMPTCYLMTDEWQIYEVRVYAKSVTLRLLTRPHRSAPAEQMTPTHAQSLFLVSPGGLPMNWLMAIADPLVPDAVLRRVELPQWESAPIASIAWSGATLSRQREWAERIQHREGPSTALRDYFREQNTEHARPVLKAMNGLPSHSPFSFGQLKRPEGKLVPVRVVPWPTA